MSEQGNTKSESSFLMQGSILAIASIVSRVVGLLYRIPLTAIIGKTGNNYYGTAFQIYNIILIISSYSLPLAVSKLVAARMAKGQVKNAIKAFKGALLFAVASGSLFSLIVFVFADPLTRAFRTPMSFLALRVLAPVIFIVAVVGVLRGFFQGLHTMIPSAVSQIFEQIVNAVVSVAAAYYLFSYGSRVGAVLNNPKQIAAAYGAAGGTLGTAMGALTALICMLFLFSVYQPVLKKRMRRDHNRNRESYRELFRVLFMTIIPVLLSTTLYNLCDIVDNGIFKNIIAHQEYDPHMVEEWWGVFTGQYLVLINVPLSIASALAASTVPTLTSAFESGEKLKVQRQIGMANRFIAVVAFPCAVGLFVLASPIMRLLFKDGDPTSAHMLMLGAVSVIFFSLSTLSNGLLQGINRMSVPWMNAGIALVVQAIVLVILMQFTHLGIYAVIITYTVYGFLMFFLNSMAVRRYSGATMDLKKNYLIPGASAIVMGIAVYVFYQLLELMFHSNFVATLTSVFVGAVVYFVVLLLMKGLTELELMRFPKGYLLVKIAKKMRLL